MDLVHELDKRQQGPDARVCQKDPSHGRLTATGSGLVLACLNVVARPGATKVVLCDYAEPAVTV